MPRISAPMYLVSGTISNGALREDCVWRGPVSCVDSDMTTSVFQLLRGDCDLRRRRRMRNLAARKRGEDTVDERTCRLGAELDRDTVPATLAFISEVDGKHVIEGRVIRMIEIDVGGVDLHPAFAALGAADERGFFDDIGAHCRSPYSAAT